MGTFCIQLFFKVVSLIKIRNVYIDVLCTVVTVSAFFLSTWVDNGVLQDDQIENFQGLSNFISYILDILQTQLFSFSNKNMTDCPVISIIRDF